MERLVIVDCIENRLITAFSLTSIAAEHKIGAILNGQVVMIISSMWVICIL